MRSSSSARLLVAGGVALLHPEDTVLEAMLTGWTRQQMARRLESETAEDRCRVVRRFAEFSGAYPWDWTAAHVDEWSTALISEQGLA
jgi:integrase/recombinase XerC